MEYNPQCTRCPLHSAGKSVCIPGEGPAPCEIMFLGRNPGYDEDRANRPFIGRAGSLLREALKRAGLREDEVFFTNVVKCLTPENREPTPDEREACRPYWQAEIERVRPKYIFAFGNTALSELTGRPHGKSTSKSAPGVTKLQGQVLQVNGITVFPMVHPSFIVRQGGIDDHRGGQIERQKFFSTLAQHVTLIRQRQAGSEPSAPSEPVVRICRSMADVRAGLEELDKCDVLAFDTETQGLRWEPDRALYLIAISGDGQTSWVFPLEHSETPADVRENMGWLKSEISRLLTTKKTVAQRAQFDLNWLRSRDIKCKATFDTKYACHLLDENVNSGLKARVNSDGDMIGAPGQVEMYLSVKPGYSLDMSISETYEYPLEDLGTYAGRDAAYTWRLREYHLERLRQNPRLARFFKHVTMPGVELLAQIEYNGFPIDREWVTNTAEATRARIKEIESRFAELMDKAGCGAWDCDGQACVSRWDWQTDDLIHMLFDVLGLPVLRRTDARGQASVNDETLVDIRVELLQLLSARPDCDECKTALEYVDLVREWSDLIKDLQFMESWEKYIWSDGRIHSTYHWEMATGRTSCRDPNAQQWPKRLKRAVRARDGWTFIAVDESQAELRLIAEAAQDETMLSIYERDGDIHRATAAAIMHKPPSEVTSEERQKAKPANFGFSYRMSAQRFQRYARYGYGVYLSLAECEEFRREFFKAYPSLASWHARVEKQCKEVGYVETFMGRRRRPAKLWSPNREEAAAALRQAINAIPQGGASDLTIFSGCQIPFDPETILPVIFVHDSFLFEVRKDMVDYWARIIKDVMENTVKTALREKLGIELRVPLKVDLRVKDTWDMTDEDAWEA